VFLIKFLNHAYPVGTGGAALIIRFYDGFQYVVTFLACFGLFSSNLLKNQQVFLIPLQQPDRHILNIQVVFVSKEKGQHWWYRHLCCPFIFFAFVGLALPDIS
jgi:hypothetical protein